MKVAHQSIVRMHQVKVSMQYLITNIAFKLIKYNCLSNYMINGTSLDPARIAIKYLDVVYPHGRVSGMSTYSLDVKSFKFNLACWNMFMNSGLSLPKPTVPKFAPLHKNGQVSLIYQFPLLPVRRIIRCFLARRIEYGCRFFLQSYCAITHST